MVGLRVGIEGHAIQVAVTERRPPVLPFLVYFTGEKLTLKQAAEGGFLIGGGWPARMRGGPVVDHASMIRNLAVAQSVAVPDALDPFTLRLGAEFEVVTGVVGALVGVQVVAVDATLERLGVEKDTAPEPPRLGAERPDRLRRFPQPDEERGSPCDRSDLHAVDLDATGATPSGLAVPADGELRVVGDLLGGHEEAGSHRAEHDRVDVALDHADGVGQRLPLLDRRGLDGPHVDGRAAEAFHRGVERHLRPGARLEEQQPEDVVAAAPTGHVAVERRRVIEDRLDVGPRQLSGTDEVVVPHRE